jgi:glycosyltransferase involved in cell wall biosynthesis
MKILHACFYDPTEKGGGIENVVYNLTKLLSQNYGVKIDLVTSGTTDMVKKEKFGNIFHLKVPQFTFLGGKEILAQKPFFNRLLKEFIKENGENYDIIHIHGDILGDKILQRFNSVFTLHGFGKDLLKYHNFFASFILDLFSIKTEINNILYAKRITAVSKMVKKSASRYTKKKIEVIYNGVNIKECEPPSIKEKLQLRDFLDLREDYKYIIFVGKDARLKRFDLAKKAVELLNSKKIKLIAIGVKEKFGGMGFVSQKKVIQYLRASDVFILPSDYDAFPVACLEALSCGLPIIISKKVGASEIIQQGVHGFIINKQKPSLYARAINNILNNKKMMQKMQKAARKLALKYRWENIVPKYYSLYRDLI